MTTATVAESRLRVACIAISDAWLAFQQAADEATDPADAQRLYRLTADLMAMSRELAQTIERIGEVLR